MAPAIVTETVPFAVMIFPPIPLQADGLAAYRRSRRLSLESLGFGCEQANNTHSHPPMSVDVVRVLITPAEFPGAFSKYTSKALRQWAL
jgi:hypothetical protein